MLYALLRMERSSPNAYWSCPDLAASNVHGSLLPRWRGAAPIERAILAGDELTGIGIMQMEEGLDTGDVARGAIDFGVWQKL